MVPCVQWEWGLVSGYCMYLDRGHVFYSVKVSLGVAKFSVELRTDDMIDI